MANGCIEGHAVVLMDRGAKRRIGEVTKIAKVEWSRKTSAKSLATITISARNCGGQMDLLNRMIPMRSEIVVYRGDRRSWEGIVIDVGWFVNRVEITVADVTHYLFGRALSKQWPSAANARMTDRVSAILGYELATTYSVPKNGGTLTVPGWEQINPPANVLPHVLVRPSTTLLTTAQTERFQMTVGAHMDDLAGSGLDYTAIGRTLYYWDSAQEIGRTRALTEADFSGELKVYDSGLDLAVIAHNSTDSGEEGVEPYVGSAGEVHPIYGPWTSIGTAENETGEDDVPNQAALNSQAERDLVGRNVVPQQIVMPEGSQLLLSDTLSIDALVPGVTMPVRATMNLREVQQDMRLQEMTVSETAEGETISVTLLPAGPLVAA